MIEISVVVLSYRSGESIRNLFIELERILQGMRISYEIILVANYLEDNKDDTGDIVINLAAGKPEVKPVVMKKEGMMGWDLLQGFKESTGKYVCFIDGDGQIPLESVRTAYNIITNNDIDVVKAYRKKRMDGLYRAVVSRVYNIIFRMLYPNVRLKDINSKPKIIKRESLDLMNLTSTDWFIDAEVMIKASKLKLDCREFPITFLPNVHRKSLVKGSAILEFIRNLIRFKFQ